MADTMDLETMSRADLAKMRVDLDRAIADAGDRDKRNALKAAEEAVRGHGFSLADLVPLMGKGSGAVRGKGQGRGAGAPATSGDVRFRNPEDHTQTWSGRGRRPRWYNDAEANGQPIEDLKAG